MDLSKMSERERAKIDMCKCGHSRAEHAAFGGVCKKCRDCLQFTWSHFARNKEVEK